MYASLPLLQKLQTNFRSAAWLRMCVSSEDLREKVLLQSGQEPSSLKIESTYFSVEKR